MNLHMVSHVFTDGGVVGSNPSSLGGTSAWRLVFLDGNTITDGVVVPATKKRKITNNHTEQIAICKALELLPDGWSGVVCSDSIIALGRVFHNWREENLPRNISERSKRARSRLGYIDTILVKGHPTKKMLSAGFCIQYEVYDPKKKEFVKKNFDHFISGEEMTTFGFLLNRKIACVYPVSPHNVACDEMCSDLAKRFKEKNVQTGN